MSENEEAVRKAMRAFTPGVHRHYKGGAYTALFLAQDHEAKGWLVVYVSHTYGSVMVRPLVGEHRIMLDVDGWTDVVTWPDGKQRERFHYGENDPTIEVEYPF